VPLKEALGRAEAAEQGVAPSGGRRRDVVPADLPVGAAANPGAEGGGQELGAEADPQNRHVAGEGLADDGHLGRQMAMPRGVVHAHGAAEHDQARVSVQGGPGVGLATEVHVANPEAGVLQEGIEGAEDLERHVLEDEQLPHTSRAPSSVVHCPGPRDERRG
jgi:hypothetical protein